MTSRTRESAPAGKEKRGTSPSFSPNTQRRRSPIPSKTNSPARSDDSTTPEKQVPNYLRPIRSSSLDAPKQLSKKPVSTINDKPNLARRRSFDKPPPVSQTQKSRISPSPALRSSSFSGKTITTPQKTVTDKNLRGPKDAGKQHTLYARAVNTVKRSSSSVKKQEIGTSSSTRKEKISTPPEKVDVNPNIPDVPETEVQSEDLEASIGENEEQTVQIGKNNEEGVEDSLLEDQEHGVKDSLMEDQEPMNIEQNEVEIRDEDSKIVSVDSSTVLEHQETKNVENPIVMEHQDASPDNNIDEIEDKSDMEEISSKQEELQEHSMNEVNTINADENIAVNQNEEVEEKERQEEHEEQEEEEEEHEKEEEAIASSKKEEVASESEAHDLSEVIELPEIVVKEKWEAENAATRIQITQGKKESPVSNDVIEETANKLREQRKNKVKALAGAFETVISLQETK